MVVGSQIDLYFRLWLCQAHAEITSMSSEKASAMQEQQILRNQLKMAWSAGNTDEVARLKKLLDPA